ncbi:hypothetical protein [Streptomyces sp. NPDC091209]|uniref:hypothetical protein n=1 Tax=Streptomyces sp. NPDC091209 TaxID=3365974 RepID=UPI003816B3CA
MATDRNDGGNAPTNNHPGGTGVTPTNEHEPVMEMDNNSPNHYTGGTGVDPGHSDAPWPVMFEPPPVPKGKSGGSGTSVDTPSMELFATNLNLLIDGTNFAITSLDDVQVEPGAFYDANKMRTTVNGPNADAGLKGQYLAVLRDLRSGLSDLHDGIITLATKYKSAEDRNSITSTDLQTVMASAPGDFTTMFGDVPKPGGGA